MAPRFPIFSSSSTEARSAALQGLLIAAIVITGLYVGREVLVPLALAILLSFVLTPIFLLLRRLKVPRVVGVAIVVTFAFALIFSLGWVMAQQATQLAENLPGYQQVLTNKISDDATSSERMFFSTKDRSANVPTNAPIDCHVTTMCRLMSFII